MIREICLSKADRGNLISFENELQMFQVYRGASDCYYSHFGYKEPSLESERVIDHIVVDIDSLDPKVIRDAVMKIKDINFNLYFSGSKGIHIVLPNLWGFTQDDISSEVIKKTMVAMFPECDQSVYNSRSLLRMPNTIHLKTDLYKIMINDIDILCDLDYIKQLAIYPGEISGFPTATTVWEKELPEPHFRIESKPSYVASPKCIHKILREMPVKGKRHQSALRLLGHFIHYDHYDQDTAFAATLNWWERLSPATKEERKALIRMSGEVEQKYKYGCNDALLKEVCDPSCAFYKVKDYNKDGRIGMRDIYMAYLNKIKHFEYFDFRQIFSEIQDEFIILDSDMVGIIGPPGSGKSTLAIDIILRILQTNPKIRAVVNNLDNGHELFIRRCIQWISGLNRSSVLRPNAETMATVSKTINEIENNITLIEEYNLERLEQSFIEWEKNYSSKPNILLVDHVGNLATKEDGYTRMRVIGDTLKKISKKYNILVIAISHIRRADSRAGTITSESARDANIGEAADLVIGVSGTNEGEIDGYRIVHINSPKSRDNKPFEIKKLYNHTNFRFMEFPKTNSAIMLPDEDPVILNNAGVLTWAR